MLAVRYCVISVLVTGWQFRYGTARLIYFPTSLAFLQCAGIQERCLNDKKRVAMIAGTEIALMTKSCFFLAYQNTGSFRSFGHV